MKLWEHRADRLSALGVAFVVGWLSSSGYYSIPKLWKAQDELVKVETSVVPQLQTKLKQSDCDKNRFAAAAIQGAMASNDQSITGPQWSDVMPCRNVAPVKAPPLSQILPKK